MISLESGAFIITRIIILEELLLRSYFVKWNVFSTTVMQICVHMRLTLKANKSKLLQKAWYFYQLQKVVLLLLLLFILLYFVTETCKLSNNVLIFHLQAIFVLCMWPCVLKVIRLCLHARLDYYIFSEHYDIVLL